MQAVCTLTGERFDISQTEQEFCRKNGLPLPVRAPFPRLRTLLAFRNRSHLYTTHCAISKKQIFSCIPPERGLNVVDVEVWESDECDPRELGRPYDFSRPFFEQFAELYREVPLPSLSVLRGTMENSDYTHGITGAKNCYLIFSCSYNEDCMFSKLLVHCKDLMDCLNCASCELCYESRHLHNCYSVSFSDNCYNCSDSSFLAHCQSCRNCYGCVNLSGKQHHFYNEPLSKEEYERRVASIDFGSRSTIATENARFSAFRADFPLRFMVGKNNQESRGNFLTNTKNCDLSYYLTDCEDMEHCVWVSKGKSSLFHCMYGNGSELIYNSVSTGDSAYNVRFSAECWQSGQDLEYSIYCGYGASHCFGSVGIKKRSYVILNKEYPKAEYEELLRRIKQHMQKTGEYGQFFPPSLSPYYFNHTEASYFLPLPREQALALGYRWNDEPPPEDVGGYAVPDNIAAVGDEILQQTLLCKSSGKRYRITRSELDFYRKRKLPVPTVSPLERLRQKSLCMSIAPLKQTTCRKCGEAVMSMYESSETTLYCEGCYQRLVY